MTFTCKELLQAGAVVVASLAMFATGLTAASSATASTNGWIFTGQVGEPVRDSDGRIQVAGQLVVPSCPDQQRGCWLAVHRVESGPDAGWREVRTAGSRLVFRTAGVFQVSWTAYLSE